MTRPVDPAGSNTSHSRGDQDPPRLQLCPRLRRLLALREDELVRLVGEEAQALAEVEERLEAARRALRSARTREQKARARRELESRWQEWFTPRTAGVYIDHPRWGKPSIAARFPHQTVFSVLIWSEAATSAIAAAGIQVHARAGDVALALATRASLTSLSGSGIWGRVRLARAWRPSMKAVVPDAGIDVAQTTPPPSTAADGTYQGDGIVLGFVDAWFDLHHPDFCSAALSSRVLRYWDQLLPPGTSGSPLPSPIPSGSAPLGLEFLQGDVDLELKSASLGSPYAVIPCIPEATVDASLGADLGHGTQVAGAAAGNAHALDSGGTSAPDDAGSTPSPGPGVAPRADLVFVRTLTVSGSRALCDEAWVLAGVSYAFETAGAAGQPCAVDLSLNDNLGAHDGSSLGEVFLDQLLQVAGRALTVSAGNENGTGSHAQGLVSPGTVSVELELAVAADLDRSDAVEIWYSGSDEFEVELWYDPPPSPTSPPPATVVLLPLTALHGTNSASWTGVHLVVEHQTRAENGDNCIWVQLELDPGAVIPAGTYTFALTPVAVVDGRFDAWIDRNNSNRSWATFLAEDSCTLAPPATARSAIIVGAHEKGSFPNVLATESGRGATRDGRQKPDLAAAGVRVWVPSASDRRSRPVNDYVNASGTSIAAPIAAGACALLFQHGRESAMCADLGQILVDLARSVTQPPPLGELALPDAGWGWGSLYLGPTAAAAKVEVDVWTRNDGTDGGDEPFPRPVFWESPDIELLTTTGAPADRAEYRAGERFSNLVRVTVRNRGSSIARNTQVYLYWADPATDIPFPAEWRSSGIYSGASPDYPLASNCIVVPSLPPGSSKQVTFAWRAPMPGSGLRGDDHFCLLARVENELDPSILGSGGFASIVASNNLALHNVHVSDGSSGLERIRPWRESRFWIRSSGRSVDLIVSCEGLRTPAELCVPTSILPWGDPRLLELTGGRRPLHPDSRRDPLRALRRKLDPEVAFDLARVQGTPRLLLERGMACITLPADRDVRLHSLRLAPGARVRACVRARAEDLSQRARIRIGQVTDGRRTGGLSVELRP